jgi:hypothetical protein
VESVSSPLHKNQPWDNDIGLFGLKIVKDVVRAFLKEAALTVLPADLLYSSGNGNHDVGGLFRRFDVSVFNSYFDKICLNDKHYLLPKHIIDQQFYSHRLLAALACAVGKIRASVIARTGGGGGF